MNVDLKKLLMEYGCQDISLVEKNVISDCTLTFTQLRDKLYLLGNILYEDKGNSVYVATISSGFRNMNYAVVAMQLHDNELLTAIYAKEGMIKQGICTKALKKLSEAAHGNLVLDSKPKWIFPSIFALIIVVATISIGRGLFMGDEPQITPLPSDSDSSTLASNSEETMPAEEFALIAEIELAVEATKEYNEAVKSFNQNVAEYNKAVSLTSVANIDGMPTSFDTLSVVSEQYEDVADVVQSENNAEKIAKDTNTVLEMASQVKALTMIVRQITAPSGEWVIERLSKIDSITGSQAVTEEFNPDGLLGKPSGYSSCIYFTVAAALPDEVPGGNTVEKGTDAGGAVEVYPTLLDAEERVKYLAGFDGTVLYSGSYAIVGTMVIRTSYKLSNEQQVELTSSIAQALTAKEVE